ncbi:neutral zinc metallopeptidase [uncultured Bradyrhizobium sp.]|uniref:neutral zinc metallopeptidase n=1 Tax=uncultured Bradyrhizobium sp. TaxID=199684 RepID=UPI002623CD44|nr:neutral zinc metallopeptidase [uncultured Bradyrhizobium sp.]
MANTLPRDSASDPLARTDASIASQPGGSVSLEPITKEQLADALNAAEVIGDDRIQETTQGRANPESFTHGSSEQRVRWFMTGFKEGTIKACNTFGAQSL